ncbi:glycosyltransferase, partial [Xenorhabdus sp. PR6a]|uniref:glycosyltransferase family 32 protein n=1 Tax=Xenorhabdus sp. PR6a TaxID=3025877 RepID=UPI002358421E
AIGIVGIFNVLRLQMIPKKIHYVWVGNQPKSELILKCIDSWKKHLPDYEIIEWNNEKFEKIKNTYSEQAFQNRKWAFVSDYIRLYALYHEGGINIHNKINTPATCKSNRYKRYHNDIVKILSHHHDFF